VNGFANWLFDKKIFGSMIMCSFHTLAIIRKMSAFINHEGKLIPGEYFLVVTVILDYLIS